VVPTAYGRAILARGHAAFDELRQGIRDIEFISDPAAGEVRIGCSDSLLAFLTLVIERLSCRHPRMRFHVQPVHWPTVEFPELHKREIDLVLARLVRIPMQGQLGDGLDAEVLFDDPFSAVVGSNNKLAKRRNLSLADLVDEPWLLTPLDVLAGLFVKHAFEAQGLKPPMPLVASYSPYLRSNLASRGPFIAVLPRSVLHVDAERYSLKRLPIQLSDKPSAVAIVRLKNRTLTPAVQVFIECARKIAHSAFGETKNPKGQRGETP
jgi:DNA-binding transcriptional LysR family regulator